MDSPDVVGIAYVVGIRPTQYIVCLTGYPHVGPVHSSCERKLHRRERSSVVCTRYNTSRQAPAPRSTDIDHERAFGRVSGNGTSRIGYRAMRAPRSVSTLNPGFLVGCLKPTLIVHLLAPPPSHRYASEPPDFVHLMVRLPLEGHEDRRARPARGGASCHLGAGTSCTPLYLPIRAPSSCRAVETSAGPYLVHTTRGSPRRLRGDWIWLQWSSGR